MSTFRVSTTLMHPENRARSLSLDILVEAHRPYTVLPEEIVAQLELPMPDSRTVQLPNGERTVWRVGETRMRLGEAERATVFFVAPQGTQPSLGRITLAAFGLTADTAHQRLVPIPAFLI